MSASDTRADAPKPAFGFCLNTSTVRDKEVDVTVSRLRKFLGPRLAGVVKAYRGEGYAAAFANRKSVRAALDKMHVTTQTPIASAREIAFFPPMTGG